MENTNQKMVKTGDENPVNRTSEEQEVTKLKVMDLPAKVFDGILVEFEKKFGKEFEFWNISITAEKMQKEDN